MLRTLAAAALATTLGATAGSATTLDFLEFANNNEHGVANGTTIAFDGVDVTFDAALHTTGAPAFAYFDHGGAGLGVCKAPRSGVVFGDGRTGAGTNNDCFAASDDNVTVSEQVTLTFGSAYNLTGLSFTGEGHSFSNPVFLEDETTGANRSVATLLFGINGGALERYTFAGLAAATFGNVESATFAFDDNALSADQFYLASAVVNPVPLPAGGLLLLGGLGAFAFARRRKTAMA